MTEIRTKDQKIKRHDGHNTILKTDDKSSSSLSRPYA